MFSWRRRSRVLTPLEGYERWAQSYSEEKNPIKDLSDDLVNKFLPDLNGKSFLDAGCGTGKFCCIAENQNASRVVGIDLSPNMIIAAKNACLKTEFRCEDLSLATLEQSSYDVIICALVMGHLRSLTPTLGSLLLALKKHGVVVLTDFHPYLTMINSKRTFTDRGSGKTFEIHHYLHLFQDYFKVFHAHGVDVEFLEEPGYQGNPVVFGIRARKR